MEEKSQEIVFFDSFCGFCWRSMLFIAQRDTKVLPHFFFAPLGGKTAAYLNIKPALSSEAHSVCVKLSNGTTYEGARAVLYILTKLTSPIWKGLGIFGTTLYPVLGWVFEKWYSFVASRRKGIFACELPSQQAKNAFSSRLLP